MFDRPPVGPRPGADARRRDLSELGGGPLPSRGARRRPRLSRGARRLPGRSAGHPFVKRHLAAGSRSSNATSPASWRASRFDRSQYVVRQVWSWYRDAQRARSTGASCSARPSPALGRGRAPTWLAAPFASGISATPPPPFPKRRALEREMLVILDQPDRPLGRSRSSLRTSAEMNALSVVIPTRSRFDLLDACPPRRCRWR